MIEETSNIIESDLFCYLNREPIYLESGVMLDVVIEGDRDAMPVIFLHGFPESARTWRHQIRHLRDRYRLIVPDQRGFGASSKPGSAEDYTPRKLVNDVIGLAGALSLDRFALVGHDWGGAVAWATAIRSPERVARLGIINAPHPHAFQTALFDDPAQAAASQYVQEFRQPDMAARLRAGGPERMLDRLIASHATPGALTAADQAAYRAEWERPGALEAMLHWYAASPIVIPRMDGSTARPDWLDRPFPSLSMPTLVIWGMQDQVLLPALSRGLDSYLSDVRVLEVEAGHFPSWETPIAVNEALDVFLGEATW